MRSGVQTPLSAPLRIAIVIPDNRDEWRRYDLPNPVFGTAPSALFSGFSNCQGIEVHVVSGVRRDVKSPKKIADNIFFHPVRVPEWGFLKTMYLPAIRRLKAKLHEIRPDLVHGQGTERYAALTSVSSGYPSLITVHGNMRQIERALRAKPFSFAWLSARLESWSLKRAAGVICLTRYTQEQVQSLAHQTWLVPNAVDEAFFTVNRCEETPAKVLCVADVAPYKCQNELIRALDPIALTRKFQLVFLGRVNGSEAYGKEFLKLVNGRPWCSYKGFKPGVQLRDELGSARLLVLPSREDNCPMVLLESMAAGVPVAASNIGGIPDLIDHEKNGLLFDPADAGQIGVAIVRLLTDSKLSEKFSQNGRAHALEHYLPIKVAIQHLQIYKKISI